jgi:hypothetical protein
MKEFPKCEVNVLKNGILKEVKSIDVQYLPDECPFCHHKIFPHYLIGFMFYDSVDRFDAMFLCPDYYCEEFFHVIYLDSKYDEKLEKLSGLPFELTYILSGDFTPEKFDIEIKRISPKFVKIYNQALEAERGGLKEISGLGFRKAVEFLLKDYTINNHPQHRDTIIKMPLSQVINNYVEDIDIKEMAHRAIWLGNDEAHYSRELSSNSVVNLKKLIKLTTLWISMKYHTEKIKIAIPKRK